MINAGRILVVDAVPTTRITMKVRLIAACYDVSMAASGGDALRLAAQTRPHIVLIADNLPDMSAAQLCVNLRTQPGCADMPIMAQVQGRARIAALQAGVSTLTDAHDDDLTLLARIRGLMRTDPHDTPLPNPAAQITGMAEPATPFRHERRARAVFIAGQPATALGWRHALQGHMDFTITVSDPERALSEAARGQAADLYLIAADLRQPGEGLRLLSELRSRPMSRDAAFVVMLTAERAGMTAVALDLGAGDVLIADLGRASAAAEAAIRIDAQLARKQDADRRRAEAQRNMMWAMTDPLTGLHNRRHALPGLARLYDQSITRNEGLAAIVMDLDRFKRINDSHGHAAGDSVLRSVAQRLRQVLPAEALLARIGGEEFLAALPSCDTDTALAIAEEIRLQVLAAPVQLPHDCLQPEIYVSLSAGVATTTQFQRQAGSGPEQLIASADRALLQAKSQGRNRIVLASSPIAA